MMGESKLKRLEASSNQALGLLTLLHNLQMSKSHHAVAVCLLLRPVWHKRARGGRNKTGRKKIVLHSRQSTDLSAASANVEFEFYSIPDTGWLHKVFQNKVYMEQSSTSTSPSSPKMSGRGRGLRRPFNERERLFRSTEDPNNNTTR